MVFTSLTVLKPCTVAIIISAMHENTYIRTYSTYIHTYIHTEMLELLGAPASERHHFVLFPSAAAPDEQHPSTPLPRGRHIHTYCTFVHTYIHTYITIWTEPNMFCCLKAAAVMRMCLKILWSCTMYTLPQAGGESVCTVCMYVLYVCMYMYVCMYVCMYV